MHQLSSYDTLPVSPTLMRSPGSSKADRFVSDDRRILPEAPPAPWRLEANEWIEGGDLSA
jgi:hypothetical protein